jgi:fluoroacetyl-CoA thioesterase
MELQKGVKGFQEIIVTINDVASKYGSGLADVFATPAMIALMESTAQSSIKNYLPEGYITVGIEVNIKHLKATPVGMKVSCESKLIDIDGKKLYFEVLATDEKGIIGKGTHTRFIVNLDEFIKNLEPRISIRGE